MKSHLITVCEKMKAVLQSKGRLEIFDRTFHEIIRENSRNLDCEIIDSNGNIQIENLKRITDKLGTGSIDFYRKEKSKQHKQVVGKCIKIPSKDTLLLIAVCLELEADTAKKLLASAGYSSNLKNKKEFIIFCGLNNIKGIDEVSGKLFEYGYREQSALMTVSYGKEGHLMKRFSDYFMKLCVDKGLDKKNVLEQADLVSVTHDPEKNKYYYNAFYGNKSVRIILDDDQIRRLFSALQLTHEEKSRYLSFLLDLGVIHEDSIDSLLHFLESDAKLSDNARRSMPAGIDSASVYTQYISNRLDHLDWDQLDMFIDESFDTIRSFAVFYTQLIEYNGYKNVADFCSTYSLSARSHYNYTLGLSLPDLTTLTVAACLFRKMTIQIYNTLLKKSGKCIFDSSEDSVVYTAAKELLRSKKSEEIMFGDMYDCIDYVVNQGLAEKLEHEDLSTLYTELVKVISRNLLSYEKNGGIYLRSEDKGVLKTLAEQTTRPPVINYSQLFGHIFSECPDNEKSGFAYLLTGTLGFAEDSPLITSILHQPGKQPGTEDTIYG